MDADKLNADADWMEMDGWRTRALASEQALREAQERAERAEAELVIANRVIARHLPSAVESVGRDAKLAASEQALRDAQGALQACSEFGCDECGDAGDTCLDRHPTEPNEWCQTCIALAALAPNTEGEGK